MMTHAINNYKYGARFYRFKIIIMKRLLSAYILYSRSLILFLKTLISLT